MSARRHSFDQGASPSASRIAWSVEGKRTKCPGSELGWCSFPLFDALLMLLLLILILLLLLVILVLFSSSHPSSSSSSFRALSVQEAALAASVCSRPTRDFRRLAPGTLICGERDSHPLGGISLQASAIRAVQTPSVCGKGWLRQRPSAALELGQPPVQSCSASVTPDRRQRCLTASPHTTSCIVVSEGQFALGVSATLSVWHIVAVGWLGRWSHASGAEATAELSCIGSCRCSWHASPASSSSSTPSPGCATQPRIDDN